MFNPFTIRKYAALVIVGILSVVMFYVGITKWGLWIGIAFYIASLLLGVLVGNQLLKNPFTIMLEGKGILAINIDSTGVLRPFIVRVAPPYIKGSLFKQPVNDVFNRSTIVNLAPPTKLNTPAERTKDGGIKIELDEEMYNKARFALFHYPVILYNQQIHSVITKDFLSDMEKDVFAEHGVLYLNRKMEELTSAVRDFGRHVVETLKPRESIFKNKWVIIIIIIFAGILLVLFLPNIIKFITGVSGNIGGATSQLTDTITPR